MLILDVRADLTLDAVRRRLTPPERRSAFVAALLSAAFAATMAVALAGVVILGPPYRGSASSASAGV